MIRRRFLAAASVISLLLCAATVVLWVRSHYVYDSLTRVTLREDSAGISSHQWTFWAGPDGATVYNSVMTRPKEGAEEFRRFMTSTVDDGWFRERGDATSRRAFFAVKYSTGSQHGACGVQYGFGSSVGPKGRDTSRALKLPYWLLSGTFGAVPVLAILQMRFGPSRQRRAGHCLRCGYNLTRNTSGICPECGTQIPESFEATA